MKLCTRAPLSRLIVERDTAPRDLVVPEHTGRVSVAVVALKGQDSAAAAPWLAQLEPEVVVVIQNGVEHEAGIVHPRVVPAIINTAVERVAPGRLVHRAGDLLTLADRPGASDFAALLEGSALRVQLEADFVTAAWRKLLANLAGNSITTLTGRRSEVFGEPAIRELAREVLVEAVAVGRAEGASLTEEDVDRTLAFFASLPPDTGSSMLYDHLAGRRLEIEPLVGAVLRAAQRHELGAPRVHTLYALLTSVGARAAGP